MDSDRTELAKSGHTQHTTQRLRYQSIMIHARIDKTSTAAHNILSTSVLRTTVPRPLSTAFSDPLLSACGPVILGKAATWRLYIYALLNPALLLHWTISCFTTSDYPPRAE